MWILKAQSTLTISAWTARDSTCKYTKSNSRNVKRLTKKASMSGPLAILCQCYKDNWTMSKTDDLPQKCDKC